MNSNSLQCIERKAVGELEWDRFVNESDEGWLYHRYAFQDALETWPSRADTSFAVFDSEDHNSLVAVIPAQVLTEPFIRVLKRKVIDVIGGPAFRNNLSPHRRSALRDFILTQLWDKAKAHRAIQINFSVQCMAPAFVGERYPRINPFLSWGCENIQSSTWMVDLRVGSSELWNRMEGRARTAIRKAEHAGVTVREANCLADLDIYYRLHEETYRRTNVIPHPKSYFDRIWKDFREKGLAHIFFAEIEGQVIAAENFSIYKKAAEYWTGASSQRGLSTGANCLLQWAAMQWMIKNKIEWYNCGEAFPQLKRGKLKGLNDFKKSFGGELFPLHRGIFLLGLKARLVHSYLTFRKSFWHQRKK